MAPGLSLSVPGAFVGSSVCTMLCCRLFYSRRLAIRSAEADGAGQGGMVGKVAWRSAFDRGDRNFVFKYKKLVISFVGSPIL